MQIGNRSGYILFVTVLILLGVFFMGVALTARSSSLVNLQESAKKRVQSFYSADGQITLLAQEIIDKRGDQYKSNTYLLYDEFDRPNKATIDSGWIETENSKDSVKIKNGMVIFSNTDLLMRPIISKTFAATTSSDTITWQFDMIWGYADTNFAKDSFSVMMQMGKDMKIDDSTTGVAVNLRWGDNNKANLTGGSRQLLSYKSTSTTIDSIIGMQGLTTIKVVAYLPSKKYDVYVNGQKKKSGLTFYNISLTSLNQIRFYVNRFTTGKFYGCEFDNIYVYRSNISSFSDTTSIVANSRFKVAWDVKKTDGGKYAVLANAYDSVAKINKSRTLLSQTISTQDVVINVYPNTVTVPVTLYDFHSDRTNPEFEQPCIGGPNPRPGMVKLVLDAEGKPECTANTDRRMLNTYMRYWFRLTSATDNTLIKMYELTQPKDDFSTVKEDLKDADTLKVKLPTSSTTRYVKDAFANKIFSDNLVFTHQGDGIYVFSSDAFFPLDNKGFYGDKFNDGDNHNYAFTMELTQTFVKIPGQFFTFKGDDDVWVFINDTLRLDLGGKHATVQGLVSVDDLTSIPNNTQGTLKLFYCERHSKGSTIYIRTNLMTQNIIKDRDRTWARNYGNIN